LCSVPEGGKLYQKRRTVINKKIIAGYNSPNLSRKDIALIDNPI
jgi:hypothetical protein